MCFLFVTSVFILIFSRRFLEQFWVHNRLFPYIFCTCITVTGISWCCIFFKFGQIHEVCPEGIQPCHVKNRDICWRSYKIQDTLYIGQWRLSPLQSRHLETSHSSPISCPIIFAWIEIDGLKSLSLQRWFRFWKSQKLKGATPGL